LSDPFSTSAQSLLSIRAAIGHVCTMDSWEALGWAFLEYGDSDLGHAARTNRLVQVASAMIQSPASSIPKAMGDAAQMKGAYRFLSNPEVRSDGILSGHTRRTAERCLAYVDVLILQDTTTVTFNTRKALKDAGPTNDGSKTKGFFAHTSLAVAADSQEVVGVLEQYLWVRSRKKKPANETSRQRKQRRRESEHWADNQQKVADVLRQAAAKAEQPAPHIIAVFDREGDIFEAMAAMAKIGHSFVIRALRNRLLDDDDQDQRHYSLNEVASAPVVGYRPVNVRAREGHPARTATLEVRATKVKIKPPRSSGRKGDSIEVNLVLAREVDAPARVEPLCWYLVTREPIETCEQVQRVLEHYEARWIIEEFHMGLKTGCGCEQRQLESIHGLRNFLALATPMAVRLLQLRDAARRDLPWKECNILGSSETAVLVAMRPRMMAKVNSTRELMRVLANLGGFVNRNGDPDPGWRTLWRGFERLKTAAMGYDIHVRASRPASGRPHSERQRIRSG
jgi:hypothetical protein